MKKLILFFILVMQVSAVDPRVTAQIYDRLVGAIFSAEHIGVHAANPEYRKVVEYCTRLHLTSDARIILAKDQSEIPAGSILPVFSGSYALLVNNPSVVGAFYWEKNHPKIVFVRSRLKRFGLRVAPDFAKYVVEHP